jgi:hypothetical protein
MIARAFIFENCLWDWCMAASSAQTWPFASLRVTCEMIGPVLTDAKAAC